jgi:hypothetical protein
MGLGNALGRGFDFGPVIGSEAEQAGSKIIPAGL